MYVINEIIYSKLKISQAIMTWLIVLAFSCCILFMKQFTEHRINIHPGRGYAASQSCQKSIADAHILATVSDVHDG